MTPQERQLVEDLFDRLATLETAPRDPEADRLIAAGLQRAPHAVYPLVQTVLLQDEALKRADARIRELSGEEESAPQQGGFLDSMRATFGGRQARGSVPSVGATPDRPPERMDPRYAGAAAASPAPGGGSFLGTAAASAVGAIGGAMLLNSISSMFGHHGGSAFAAIPEAAAASPWDKSAANSDLARDAGVGDVGQGGGDDQHASGLFGDANDPDPDNSFGDDDFDTGDDGGDFGGDDGGDL